MAKQPFGYLLGVGARPALLHGGDRLTFGRDPQNSFSFDDALLSRMHAAVSVTEDGLVTVQDLNSTNFTWLNDQQIRPGVPMQMKSGDNFRIGGQVMTYIANEEDVSPGEAGMQKKVRMATMDTIVISKPTFSDEGEGASTRLQEAVAPIGGAIRTSSDTAMSAKRPETGPPVSLEGDLKDHMFPQLLQYLHTSRKTGELLIDGPSQQAVIGFQEGKITFAQMGDELGIGVIHSGARWGEGKFRFKTMEQLSHPKNVVHPTMTIVLKCCQIMDEGSE